MNESPAQNQNFARKIRPFFLTWLILLAAICLMLAVIDLIPSAPKKQPILPQAVFAAVTATICLGLWSLIRWGCNRRNFGRLLVVTAILVTLTIIFYQEEDWRGLRAWQQCKADLEAKGFVMDWDKFIPPAEPDDQNFFTASTNIAVRFKKAVTDSEPKVQAPSTWFPTSFSGTNSWPEFNATKTNPLVVATITVLTNAANPDTSAFALDDPTTPQKIRSLIQDKTGRIVDGATGLELSERSLTDLQQTGIALIAGAIPTTNDLRNLVPSNSVAKNGQLKLLPTDTPNVFQVGLADLRIATAANYLKWSDQYLPAMDEIREALKRPYAIIPGDYTRPYLMPIPNFVMLRALAQMLAQRTQSYLLLGEPDKALREITLMHDVCRILTKPPTGKPETLVEAMINVAIFGLYANTVADGLHLHAWQEPQLIALQEQLRDVDLPTPVEEAFRAELIATAHTLEISSPSELLKLFSLSGAPPPNRWDLIRNPNLWLLYLAPRGWYYQNMTFAARLSSKNVEGLDLSNNRISPQVISTNASEIESSLHQRSLWSSWAAIAIPNTTKAYQTTAYNQTLINEALIVCALERYHLAHGDYPTTLDALVPQYISTLPHDLIGGQPLHYHPIDNEKFVLYSIGWNENDDAGTVAQLKNGTEDRNNGDWVWPNK